MAKAQTGLKEFTLFPDLPAEIQMAIFEMAIPMRLFILVPYPGRCRPTPRPQPVLPRYSWVVLPRSAAVPALLHTCRRARDLLLRTGVYEPARTLDPRVRFSSPVVAYAHDVFAVCPMFPPRFDRQRPWEQRTRQTLPLMLGVDRARVRHAAWFQTTLRPPQAGHYFARCQMGMERLPALESLMLIETEFVCRTRSGRPSTDVWMRTTTSLTPGGGMRPARPRPGTVPGTAPGTVPSTVPDAVPGAVTDPDRPMGDIFCVLADQPFDYELHELAVDPEREALGILANPATTPAACRANRLAIWTQQMQDFYAATYMARAWLWHQHHPPPALSLLAAGEQANNAYQTVLDTLHVPAWYDSPCMLCAMPPTPAGAEDAQALVDELGYLPGTVHALGGHTVADLRSYQPPFALRYGYLCRSTLAPWVKKYGFRVLYEGPPQRDPQDALRFVTEIYRQPDAW